MNDSGNVLDLILMRDDDASCKLGVTWLPRLCASPSLRPSPDHVSYRGSAHATRLDDVQLQTDTQDRHIGVLQRYPVFKVVRLHDDRR